MNKIESIKKYMGELQERRTHALAEMRSLTENAEKANRELNATETATFKNAEADCDKYDARIDIQKSLLAREEKYALQIVNGEAESRESTRDLPNCGTEYASSKNDKKEEKYHGAFQTWLKNGTKSPEIYATAEAKGSDVVGSLPFYNQVIKGTKYYSGPMQAGAEIIYSTTGNDLNFICSNDTSNVGRLFAENATGQQTNIAKTTANMKFYNFSTDTMLLTNVLIQDAGFDTASWIADAASERLGRAWNQYQTVGTNSTQPQGIVYASTEGTTTAIASYDYTDMVNLFHSVDPSYRADPSCYWEFNDSTLKLIRLMKDGANQYIFQAGTAGQPDKILDKPYVVNPNMDSMDSNAAKKPVIFGAHRYFKIGIVTGITLQRLTEKYAEDNQTGYVGFARMGSVLTNTAAIKHILTNASGA